METISLNWKYHLCIILILLIEYFLGFNKNKSAHCPGSIVEAIAVILGAAILALVFGVIKLKEKVKWPLP